MRQACTNHWDSCQPVWFEIFFLFNLSSPKLVSFKKLNSPDRIYIIICWLKEFCHGHVIINFLFYTELPIISILAQHMRIRVSCLSTSERMEARFLGQLLSLCHLLSAKNFYFTSGSETHFKFGKQILRRKKCWGYSRLQGSNHSGIVVQKSLFVPPSQSLCAPLLVFSLVLCELGTITLIEQTTIWPYYGNEYKKHCFSYFIW